MKIIDKNVNNSKKRMIFTKKLFISYNLITMLFLSLAIWMFTISANEVKGRVDEQTFQLLNSSISQLDRSYESLAAIVGNVRADQNLIDLCKYENTSDNNFYRIAYDTQHSLQEISHLQNLLPVSNFFVYMSKSRYVVSPTSFASYDFYYKYTLGYPQDFQAELPNFLTNPSNWWHITPTYFTSENDERFLYIQPISNTPILNFAPSQNTAILCYEFTQGSISAIFSDINLYGTGYILASDEKNGEIFPLVWGENAEIPSEFTEIEALFTGEELTATYMDSTTDEKKLVTKIVSSYNGWSYYLVLSYDEAYLSVTKYQSHFILILASFLFISASLTVLLTIYNSKPMEKIRQELNLERDQRISLNDIIEQNQPVVTEAYIREIIEGNLSSHQELSYIIQSLGLYKDDVQYQVLYTEALAGAEPSSDMLTYITKEQSVLIREALKRFFPDTGYSYNASAHRFVSLVASPKETDFNQLVAQNQKNFEAMHCYLLEEANIWISGGFSVCTQDVTEVWRYLESAKNAKAITTMRKYVICDGDSSCTDDIYYYPETLAMQLSGYITTGNKEKSLQIFNVLEAENMVNRALSPSQRQYLLADFRNTLFKIYHRTEIAENATEEKQEKYKNLNKKFQKEISFVAMRSIMIDLCILNESEGFSGSRIAKIKDYINTNYSDSDLGLKRISEEFEISENYFSFLFKKETGENFFTYLEKLRMSKAKDLALSSDIAVSNLYKHVGYSNATSFNRAFKRTYGMSPKQMKTNKN